MFSSNLYVLFCTVVVLKAARIDDEEAPRGAHSNASYQEPDGDHAPTSPPSSLAHVKASLMNALLAKKKTEGLMHDAERRAASEQRKADEERLLAHSSQAKYTDAETQREQAALFLTSAQTKQRLAEVELRWAQSEGEDLETQAQKTAAGGDIDGLKKKREEALQDVETQKADEVQSAALQERFHREASAHLIDSEHAQEDVRVSLSEVAAAKKKILEEELKVKRAKLDEAIINRKQACGKAKQAKHNGQAAAVKERRAYEEVVAADKKVMHAQMKLDSLVTISKIKNTPPPAKSEREALAELSSSESMAGTAKRQAAEAAAELRAADAFALREGERASQQKQRLRQYRDQYFDEQQEFYREAGRVTAEKCKQDQEEEDHALDRIPKLEDIERKASSDVRAGEASLQESNKRLEDARHAVAKYEYEEQHGELSAADYQSYLSAIRQAGSDAEARVTARSRLSRAETSLSKATMDLQELLPRQDAEKKDEEKCKEEARKYEQKADNQVEVEINAAKDRENEDWKLHSDLVSKLKKGIAEEGKQKAEAAVLETKAQALQSSAVEAAKREAYLLQTQALDPSVTVLAAEKKKISAKRALEAKTMAGLAELHAREEELNQAFIRQEMSSAKASEQEDSSRVHTLSSRQALAKKAACDEALNQASEEKHNAVVKNLQVQEEQDTLSQKTADLERMKAAGEESLATSQTQLEEVQAKVANLQDEGEESAEKQLARNDVEREAGAVEAARKEVATYRVDLEKASEEKTVLDDRKVEAVNAVRSTGALVDESEKSCAEEVASSALQAKQRALQTAASLKSAETSDDKEAEEACALRTRAISAAAHAQRRRELEGERLQVATTELQAAKAEHATPLQQAVAEVKVNRLKKMLTKASLNEKRADVELTTAERLGSEARTRLLAVARDRIVAEDRIQELSEKVTEARTKMMKLAGTDSAQEADVGQGEN